ncbi:hypothetical protein DICPUDRAFT_159732 [Dictyostelium purpureum]|uniref:UV radiation resistance-associated gene protein n=1 Tax=Dictyostelium purpureum TaxID=5786 RepID=F1A4V0_DICPU|nr:uncharacterized protein DICPUDRAFT_159732 [Dictyostelium purpureum]EGC28780.1 hypothetical protein DICPUDRAFT_159732 [Dictyostelium purpureum]|eukprot:XP_003294694.1 hypothetical protein DICPUDRAFT_159732 [Dictyostelium purpureum]
MGERNINNVPLSQSFSNVDANKRQQLYRDNISASSIDLTHNNTSNNNHNVNSNNNSNKGNNSSFHSKSKSLHPHTQNKLLIQQTQQQIQQYHNINEQQQKYNNQLHNSTVQFNNNNTMSNSLYISNGPSSFPPSLRKFRHIKSIIGRNLESCNKSQDPVLLTTYYTLHAPPNVNINQLNQLNHNHYFGDDTINTTSPIFNSNWNDMENVEIEALENILNSDDEKDQEDNSVKSKDNNEKTEINGNNDVEINNKDNEESNNINNNIDEDGECCNEENEENKENDNGDDDDDLPAAFYTSEVIYDSNNPLWNPFDCYKQLSVEILDYYSSFNICVWDKDNEDIPPIFQSDIDLTQLEFIAAEIKHFSQLNLPSNTILFELKDGFYVTKETKNKMNSPNLNDIQKIINNEKRKAVTGTKTLFLSLLHRKLVNIEKQNQSKIIEKKIEDILEEQSSYTERLRQLETQKNRIKLLREEASTQKQLLKKDQEKFEDLKKDLVPKSVQLTKAGISFYQSLKELIKNNEILKMDLHLVHNLKVSWEKKKWNLITQIRSIYPIGQGNKLLTINGLPLPNSDYNGYDEEQIATALGYVCHILHLASKYLNVPLRYPMTPMGSRSFIKDEISHHSSSKFPLYSKGVEKRIFDYAVFLLNKNLKQLLNSQGLFGNFYLKETLPNVQILLGKGKISELNNPNYNPIIKGQHQQQVNSPHQPNNPQQQHYNQHHINDLQQQHHLSHINHIHQYQQQQQQQHFQNQHHFNNPSHHTHHNHHIYQHQNHHLQQPH